MSNLSTDLKIFLGIIIGTLVLVFGAVFMISRNNSQAPNPQANVIVPQELLVEDDSWIIGSPSAKVTLVEFSDLQCPACKAAQPLIKEIIANNQDKSFRFVYRHYPLSSHRYSLDASIAAEAAGRQDKFWEYHDKLFEVQPTDNSQDNFKRENLIKYAGELGLDTDKFAKDLDDPSIRQKVLDDMADGNQVGVTGTPTFFVNNQKYQGSFPSLTTEIESRLSN